MNITREEFADGAWVLAHPDDVGRVKAVWSASVNAGTDFETEMRLRPKHASAYHWYLVRAVPHRDASGKVDKWFGTTTDIDGQQRAFAALDFLADSSSRLAGAQNVHTVLDRLARASLEGLADISIFDLEEDGRFVRLALAATSVPRSAMDIVNAFEAPKPGESHPIARAMDTGNTVHISAVDEAFVARSVGETARQEAWRVLEIRSIVCAPMVIPGRVNGALTLVRLGASAPFEGFRSSRGRRGRAPRGAGDRRDPARRARPAHGAGSAVVRRHGRSRNRGGRARADARCGAASDRPRPRRLGLHQLDGRSE
jgi:hypothetical protein